MTRTEKWYFMLEPTRRMSEEDDEDLCALMELLAKRYGFKWSRQHYGKN